MNVIPITKENKMTTPKTWIDTTVNWNNSNPEDAKWWVIRDADQNEVVRLPYSLGEHGVMAIVHAVRDLEKASFEAGKEFGGQAMLAAGRQKMRELTGAIDVLVAHNTHLADKLESLIGDKD
jgi:hypothetical protein